jgi:TolB-like protein
MRRTRLTWCLVAALAPVLASAQAAPVPKKIRIAVLEIRALGTEASRAELLSEIALTEAASMPGYEVIGKSDIASMLGFERQKKVMGCTDDSSCLAEVGGALGVDFILVGSLGRIGTLQRLDLKLVDVKRSRVRGRVGVSVQGKEEAVVAEVQKAVHDLLDRELGQRADPPVAKAPPHLEARPEKAPASAGATAIPLPPPPRTTPRTGVATAAPTDGRRRWAYVAGGAGLALVAGGAVAGLSAKSAYDDEKAASARGDKGAYDSAKSKVKSMSAVADGLFLAGAVGVGAGTYLFFTSGRSAPVAVGVSPVAGGAVASVAGGF